MQKLISKYSLAAHLAFLLAAPLFLYPFSGTALVCKVVPVLALFAAAWMLMEPSRRRGEMLHDARQRFQWSVAASPLFYFALATFGYCVLTVFNDGLELVYDLEKSSWTVLQAAFPTMPASVSGVAVPSLVAAFAAFVAVLGMRFGLGRGARSFFLFCFSLLAGFAGIALAVALMMGDNARVVALVRAASSGGSAVGCLFGLAFLTGIAAAPAAFERVWMPVVALSVPAIGGSFVGMYLCSSSVEIICFTAASVVILALGVVYAVFAVAGPGAMKCVVIYAVSVGAGAAFMVSLLPSWAGIARFEAMSQLVFLPRDFIQIRSAIDAALLKAWSTSEWIGTGVGTFGWDLRFHLQAEDWLIVPQNAVVSCNGWMTALCERGYAGLIAIAAPAAAVLVEWIVRLVGAIPAELDRASGGEPFRLMDPQAWVGVVGALVIVFLAFFGETPFSPAVLTAAAALFAFSVNAFRPAIRRPAPSKTRSDQGNG